ncbi:hypothetical protein I4U23_021856 [Adineta vaga]|nr:hypothetical protein I4U23_021856 [Adineta vaga]
MALVIKRLTIQYSQLLKDPTRLCSAQPKDFDKDITYWIGYLDGPEQTLYDGGRFYLTINFPFDYPFKPPQVRFTTPICLRN